MKTGKKGLDLIKSFEGLRLEAYLCPAKVLTIGYGHTGLVKGEPIETGMKINTGQAIELLKADLHYFETAVSMNVKVPLTQNQFDALVSFCYNAGAGNFIGSTLLRKLNMKDYKGASLEFPKWNKAKGKILAGLTRRRKAEQALFLSK